MERLFTSFDFVAFLFIMAALIGVANERTLRLPHPIALMIGAMAISFLLVALSAVLPTDLAERARLRLGHSDLSALLLDGVLALLLFAASVHVDLAALRRRAAPILALATVGVVLSTLLFGAGIYGIFQLFGIDVAPVWCLLLGAILAPTDAVAVDQLLTRVAMPAELRVLISGESLFNDGAAVVLFFAMLAAATGDPQALGHGRLAFDFLIAAVGASVLGFGAGMLGAAALKRTVDATLSVTVSLALVFATYRLAVWFDFSGPIAVVVAGLVFFHRGRLLPDSESRMGPIKGFWSIADDLLNTLLFLLMGFEILAVPFTAATLLPALMAVPLALAVRCASVAVPVLFERAPWGGRIAATAALTWTGLRGGISLALVLGLPEGPHRDVLAAVCYAVVAFTVIVQGLTTPAVIRRLYPTEKAAP